MASTPDGREGFVPAIAFEKALRLLVLAAWVVGRPPVAVAAPQTQYAKELVSCRSAVSHGKARIEVAQTRRLVNPAKGSPHVCRAEVSVRGPAGEMRRIYADIDPVGAEFGVSILPRPIGRFRAVAKVGDYDGRLLLVDELGAVVDLPGPEHLTAEGRFLILRHHTDAWLALAIFDLDARELVFLARGEALARLFGPDVDSERLWRLRWLEVGGALYAWLPPGSPGLAGAALQIRGQDGTLVPASLSPEQIANARQVSFQGLEGWEDCSCGAESSKPPRG